MATRPLRSSRHGPSGMVLLEDALGLARRIDQALDRKRTGLSPAETPRHSVETRVEADEVKHSEVLEPTDIVHEESDH